MNKIIELTQKKQEYITQIDDWINVEASHMIQTTLSELGYDFEKVFEGAYFFKIQDAEYYLSHRKGENQIKFGNHNMVFEINLLNHDTSKSDRVGTGLEQWYLKRLIENQIEKIYPNKISGLFG